MNALLVNTGSSSLKISLRSLTTEAELASASVDWSNKNASCRLRIGELTFTPPIQGRDAGKALLTVLHELRNVDQQSTTGIELAAIQGIAHRVVHGGEQTNSASIDEALLEELSKLARLAPLHIPPCIAAIQAARESFPLVPQLAVFDTAFHRTMPLEAVTYAIPQQWTREWQLKKYGFHGLSHAYCSEQASRRLIGRCQTSRIIICHLGHGCSASAVRDGKCIDTTMGFTPLDGLMMATRCGAIDPGIVLYVQQYHGLSADEVYKVLYERSGLLGVSGISADLRDILAAAEAGDSSAALAISLFCYSVQKTIAALTVPLGGIDALVFSGGIGENSSVIRAKICARLQHFGILLDEAANVSPAEDGDIAASNSPARIFVIASREDLTLLRELRDYLHR